ncbi:MAG: type II toxin-antitoxin system RelE family toxin [Dehalococcoidia bacterium]
MSSTWNYIITPRARRDLERLAAQDRRRIFDALDHYVSDPGWGDIRKLRGKEDEWRLRVGELRVRFERDDQARIVNVLRVLPRGRAYRD